MSRYLPLRVYDYYAPGNLIDPIIFQDMQTVHCRTKLIEIWKYNAIPLKWVSNPQLLLSFTERFNETIFDYIPTYLLNICEVCGSSQCPYCSIYNAAVKSPVPLILIISMSFVLIVRHFRMVRPNSSWLLLVISWFD